MRGLASARRGGSFRNFSVIAGPILRAIGVVGSVGLLVTGVTFAALQSQQAVLTGNTIQSASADLRIGTTSTSFAASRGGFSFQDLIPGGPAMPTDGNVFYLKNYGTANLGLRVAISSTPTNTSSVDLAKVFVQISRVDTGAQQQVSLQSLMDGYPSGGTVLTDPLGPNVTAQYKLRASMAPDAFAGSSASVGSIDLVFTGIAQPSQGQ